MKIEYENKRVKNIFSELDIGDVFEHEEKYYMRVEEIYSGKDIISNAVNFNGNLFFMYPDHNIKVINAKLVIER